MSNQEIAQRLEELGTLFELKGENPFKCRAFHNAARILSTSTADLDELTKNNTLTTIKGVGPGIAEVIADFIRTGSSVLYTKTRASFPETILDLTRVPGLGPKRVKVLYTRLKISSLPDLQKAASEHRLAKLEGFGEKIEENILASIDRLARYQTKRLYREALPLAKEVLASLQKVRGVELAEITGSLRRRKEVIGDIDILVACEEKVSPKVMKAFTGHALVESVIAAGDTKSSVVLKGGMHCDLRTVRQTEYPFALLYFTGSKEHNVEVRGMANQLGWSLNEYAFSPLPASGKSKRRKPIPRCASEKEVYRALGLSYIEPELREDMGELEAAREGKLPSLIEDRDIRGTFHCHTTASDGRATLEEMLAAAAALGWEYLGIGDHSKVAVYAHGLTEERLKEQLREIDKLNARGGPCRLFTGTEVDILPDGSLDWSDKVLARFDYVVASIHSKFNMTEAEATRRLIKAIRNKYVTMLGHPTGRLLLERDGYPVNMKDLLKAAADYGTVIEINADPLRLDLDWRFCRRAKELGIPIAINPDAHSTEGLRNVSYGVNIARKGWLEAPDVLNTLSVGKVQAFFRKRSGST